MKCNYSERKATHEYIVYTNNKETTDVISPPLIKMFWQKARNSYVLREQRFLMRNYIGSTKISYLYKSLSP
jgi:hypothetical protein